MPLIRSWSRVSNILSVGERGATSGGGLHAETLQDVVGAPATGLQPDLVQPQNVLVRVGVRGLADFVQSIDHRLEVLRQLAEYLAENPRFASGHRVGKGSVGPTAHGDVIVDVDQLARKALCEESRDEERDIAQTLQAAVAISRGTRLQSFGEHDHKGFEAC